MELFGRSMSQLEINQSPGLISSFWKTKRISDADPFSNNCYIRCELKSTSDFFRGLLFRLLFYNINFRRDFEFMGFSKL